MRLGHRLDILGCLHDINIDIVGIGLNIKLENWRKVLEDNGLRISREKTEYLRCDFSDGEITHNEEVDIRIGDKILQPKESFRYHGSMLHKSERIDEDVSNRIKAAWMKWRAATGVLCDRNVPLKLKGKFYRVAIRPAILYESECWLITKALANMVEVAELRMLRWTCGKTLLDMIPNGVYRAQLEVEMIINKMREGRLRMLAFRACLLVSRFACYRVRMLALCFAFIVLVCVHVLSVWPACMLLLSFGNVAAFFW
ncbi:hypothetical protein Tco_1338191 [Tanacetum coccineum]